MLDSNTEEQQYFEEYDIEDGEDDSPYGHRLDSARRVVKNLNISKEEAAEMYGVKIEDI